MPPPDHRRINGPETSFDFKIYSAEGAFKKPSKQRTDGRSQLSNHRSLFMQTGVLSQAKGSAYIEQGNTKIACGVYGPREIPKRSDFSMSGVLFCHLRRSPFSSEKRRPPGTNRSCETEDKELSKALKEALESTIILQRYPKSQIDVYVTVLEDDGSILAASLTCAGLALADASIQMFGIVVGASMKRLGDIYYVDPSRSEEDLKPEDKEQHGLLTVGCLPTSEQTNMVYQEGNILPSTLLSDLDILNKVCTDLSQTIENYLLAATKQKCSLNCKSK